MQGHQIFVMAFTPTIIIIVALGCAQIQAIEHVKNSPKHKADNSIFPEKSFSSEIQEEVATFYISFTEIATNGQNGEYVKSAMEKIGKNYTAVVLNIVAFNSEVRPEDSISTLFLNALLAENDNRQVEGLGEPLKIYLQIPAKSMPDFDSLNDFLWDGVESGVFLGWRGKVQGIIYDSHLFTTPFVFDEHMYSDGCTRSQALCLGLKNLETFIGYLWLIFGDEKGMEMGVSVSSHLQCASLLIETTTSFFSGLDFILYNGYRQKNDYFEENPWSNVRSWNCRKLLDGKRYYRVNQVL